MLKNLTFQVFLAATLGIFLALAYDAFVPDGSGTWIELIALTKSTFLALLKMLIAPMIFFSLIGGIISIGSVVRLRQLGGITVSYYLLTTGIAILLALAAVLFIHPWTAYPPLQNLAPVATAGTRMLDPGSDSLVAVLSSMASLAFTNPFTALVNLNILGIVTNALLIGVAMVMTLAEDSPAFKLVGDINKVIMHILDWVIRILPIGIFAILFDFTLRLGTDGHGGDFLTQLLQFGLLIVGLTLVHGLVVLPLIAWFATGMNPLALLSQLSHPLIVAFSTSSSAATLPVSMRTAEEKLDVKPGVYSFVLPLGATMNMDGTALFEAVAAVFLAYLYGIELSSVMMITVFLMAMVASIGAPGMPSASMSGMQMVMLAIGIPLEAIAILLVIERPLDTIRTAVNVEGDLIGSLVVDRYLKRRA